MQKWTTFVGKENTSPAVKYCFPKVWGIICASANQKSVNSCNNHYWILQNVSLWTCAVLIENIQHWRIQTMTFGLDCEESRVGSVFLNGDKTLQLNLSQPVLLKWEKYLKINIKLATWTAINGMSIRTPKRTMHTFICISEINHIILTFSFFLWKIHSRKLY